MPSFSSAIDEVFRSSGLFGPAVVGRFDDIVDPVPVSIPGADQAGLRVDESEVVLLVVSLPTLRP